LKKPILVINIFIIIEYNTPSINIYHKYIIYDIAYYSAFANQENGGTLLGGFE